MSLQTVCTGEAMYEREGLYTSSALLSECSTANVSPYLTETDTDADDQVQPDPSDPSDPSDPMDPMDPMHPMPLDPIDQLSHIDSYVNYSDKHYCAAMLDKHELLRNMFARSKADQLKKVPLSASVLDVRQSCVYNMQKILHFANMSCTGIVHESTVIQSILLLDWIIANEYTYFTRMEHDVLSGVCVILNCEHSLAAPIQQQELFRIVSKVVYGNDNPSTQQRLAVQVAFIEQQVASQYRQIFFRDYIAQYVGHDPCAMSQMVHGLYLYMTQNRGTWLLNTYETFVEVALKQTRDVQTHIDIMDDYLVICV